MTQVAPLPKDETARLIDLKSFCVLDTEPEQAFDDLTTIAANICQTPIALISLVDENRQWFKSKVGVDANETSRDIAFCAHALLQPESLLVVPDATCDSRFKNNPLVTDEPHIRFYAGAPLLSEQGRAIGTLCVIDTKPRELSDTQIQSLEALSRQVMAHMQLQYTNEQLNRVNKELDSFAYIASHDLKEPLRTITSYIKLLEKQSGHLLDEEGKEYFTFIEKAGEKLKQLVVDLLAYSRIDIRQDALKDVDIKEVIEQTVLEYHQQIQDAKAEIHYPDDLPIEQSIRPWLAQLFRNLIGNALKYHHDEGVSIHITCEARAHEWHFCVSDNGIGIDPKYHEQIFEMFKRLHTYDEYPGTGIGLAICRKITERLNGKIWLESNLGEGANFHFTIPRY